MSIIGCTKTCNCRKDAFLKRLAAQHIAENPQKQDEGTDTTSGEATILSDVVVTPDLSGNPDDVARHASGNKHPGERAATAVDGLEETVAAAQKENAEIPQVATTVPETLVRAQRADVSELSVDSQGNED